MKRDGGRQEQKKTEDKKKKIKQKVLHNHKQSHKFQKRENVGSLFFLPRYRKKTPKTCRSLSPLPRATSPLLNCSSSSVGRHALSRWSVVYFYCFFIFFLLLLIALFPGSSAQWPHQEHVPPHCHLPVLSGSPSSVLRRAMRLGSLPRCGIRSLPLCQAVAIAGAKLRGCYS